jgi:hypothetical protein
MKIRSVLLGSLAAVGLSTTGFAADLGVVTSLDICDELGLSGLTISSDDNCLVISGGVEFEYSIGDYAPGIPAVGFWRDGSTKNVANDDGTIDSGVTLSAWLKFVATADSDFGPANATIKLLVDEWNGNANNGPYLEVDEAWVGIGDTTMIMAGKKGSIFKQGDDEPLNYLGLFNSSDVNTGVGFSDDNNGNGPAAGVGAATGGVVIQIVSNLGNGLSIGGGLENLDSNGNVTAVGVISYAGDGLTAHVSGAVDRASDWKVHAGFTGAWDPIKVVGAFAANNDANATGGIWWNALGSASATFDMFTLAVSGEATSESEWGVGGSVSAAVADGVKINLGSRYFNTVQVPSEVWQTEAGVSAAVTETLTLTAAIGLYDSTNNAADNFYGKAGLAWAPGGGFTSSIAGEVNSLGAYKATFKAAKDY